MWSNGLVANDGVLLSRTTFPYVSGWGDQDSAVVIVAFHVKRHACNSPRKRRSGPPDDRRAASFE
ncbi:hypothetical protein H4W30_007906 [Amycolatopsis roodepoortensis]|uniref:Uncharacterized protein n=1 Tax=Amycolatopsis roodepoortensis TaxID=700274 RepID=A0ABR9LKL1_9PSEU|nr:hypothetical protein [Amycolatopsis roodepoortensis]